MEIGRGYQSLLFMLSHLFAIFVLKILNWFLDITNGPILISWPHFYSQLLPLHPFSFPYIHPFPSSLPAAQEPHCGIDRKTSPVFLWALGGMYITDQRFCCLLSATGSNTALMPMCVRACISQSDIYETENLPHFSPHSSFRWAPWKSHHLCLQI